MLFVICIVFFLIAWRIDSGSGSLVVGEVMVGLVVVGIRGIGVRGGGVKR